MANRIHELTEWLRTCPQLTDLLCIGGVEDMGVSVIFPQGASEAMQYRDYIDVNGDYNCDMTPNPSVYEDYQINCYRIFDRNDKTGTDQNINLLSYDDVHAVCEWIKTQDEQLNFPQITGERIVSVECVPFTPQISMINEAESLIAYFITLRLRYVNRRQGRSMNYEN